MHRSSCEIRYALWLVLLVSVFAGFWPAAGVSDTQTTTATGATIEQNSAHPARIHKIGLQRSTTDGLQDIFFSNYNHLEVDSVSTRREHATLFSNYFSESQNNTFKKNLFLSKFGDMESFSCVTGHLLSTNGTYTRFSIQFISSHAQCQQVCTMLQEGQSLLTYTYNLTNRTCGCLFSMDKQGSYFAPSFDAEKNGWLTCFRFPYNLIDPRALSANCARSLVAPLPESALTSTSSHNEFLLPKCAKLFLAPSDCTGVRGSWSPNTLQEYEYLQINFLELKTITGYAIMARINDQPYAFYQWVKSFYLYYSYDGTSFALYSIQGKSKVFKGNSDAIHAVHEQLPYPIFGVRYLRIYPDSYNNYKSMRIEIYGCDSYK